MVFMRNRQPRILSVPKMSAAFMRKKVYCTLNPVV